MSNDSRFAIRERDELKHKLKRERDLNDQYLKTIQDLREQIEILKTEKENIIQEIEGLHDFATWNGAS